MGGEHCAPRSQRGEWEPSAHSPRPSPPLLFYLHHPLPPPGFGSLPCILDACSGDIKSASCINLSSPDAGSNAQHPRPRVLLKAPTLAEMEEMNTSEVRARRSLQRPRSGSGGQGSEQGLSEPGHPVLRAVAAPAFEAAGLLWGWGCPGNKHGGAGGPFPVFAAQKDDGDSGLGRRSHSTSRTEMGFLILGPGS